MSEPATDMNGASAAGSASGERPQKAVSIIFFGSSGDFLDNYQGIQSRLLSILLFLFLIAFLTIAIAVRVIETSTAIVFLPFGTLILGIPSALLIAAFLLNRRSHFRAAVWTTVFALSCLPYAIYLGQKTIYPDNIPLLFGWQLAVLVFASIFFKPTGFSVLAIAETAALLAFITVERGVEAVFYFPTYLQFLAIWLLLVLSVSLREIKEKSFTKRIEELKLAYETEQGLMVQGLQLHTQELESRLTNQQAAAELVRTIGTIFDEGALYSYIVEALPQAFNFEYAGVFIIDDTADFANLMAGSGEAGTKMAADGHRLAVGGASMVGWAISHKKTRIAQDVSLEPVHYTNPHLPATRAELAIPLLSGDEVLGAVTVQSQATHAFDDEVVALLETVASSLVSSLEHILQFRKVAQDFGDLQKLHYGYLAEAWSEFRVSIDRVEYTSQDSTGPFAEGELSTIAIPLKLREQVIGELTVETDQSEWTPEELAFIEAIAKQAAVAMENARLLDETRTQAEQDRIATEIVGKLYGTTDVDQVLRTGLRELSLALNAAEGVIRLGLDGDSQLH